MDLEEVIRWLAIHEAQVSFTRVGPSVEILICARNHTISTIVPDVQANAGRSYIPEQEFIVALKKLDFEIGS